MKELKFRAWDTHNKIWLDPNIFNVRCHDGRLQRRGCEGFIGGVKIVQFTGLKDKNGVEIYEGYVLKLEYESIKMVGYVKQQEDGEWIFYKDKGNFLGVHHNKDHISIIGNIYENPELLQALNPKK